MMIDVFEETIPDEILFYAIELYFIFLSYKNYLHNYASH